MTIISVEKWGSLADIVYVGGELDLRSAQIVYCQLEHIKELFGELSKTDKKIILVSAYCDYSLCYQLENPVWADWYKGLLISQDKVREADYTIINLPPRCIFENCSKSDKYSIKCHSHTHSTFNEIPENVVRWFCTNVDVDDEVVESIPFGININEDHSFASRLKIPTDELINKTYCNWQNFTEERLNLLQWLKGRKDLATCSAGLSFANFLNEIERHLYVLCPSGNGLDTHRLWETLYLGRVPVVLRNRFFTRLLAEKFPAHFLNNWCDVNLLLKKDAFIFEPVNIQSLDFEWWANKISEARKLI